MGEGLGVLLQTVANGLTTGALYSALAMAIAVIYRGTQVVNFAQADIAMMLTFVFWTALRVGAPWYAALALAVALAVVLGLVVERLILRPLVGEPLFTVVMATIGLSTVLQGSAGLIWGHETYRLPDFFPGSLSWGSISVLRTNVFSIVLAGAILAVTLLFLQRSRSGLAMRATAADQDTAQLMGIRINRMFAQIWTLAGLISLGAGIALAFSQFLATEMGGFILRVFPALILGGLDSIGGVFLGGLIVGLLTSLAGAYLGGLMGGGTEEVVSYVLTFLILMLRPYGLFGTPEVERV